MNYLRRPYCPSCQEVISAQVKETVTRIGANLENKRRSVADAQVVKAVAMGAQKAKGA